MWGAFSQWCLSQQPPATLDRLSSDDLERFVASRRGASADGELSRRHAWRMLRLIDRVLTHRAGTRELAHNDAARRVIAAHETLRRANLEAAALPDHFDADDARQLVVHLSALRAGQPGQRWQDLRNATAVALQLGAGLTPGDVRALAEDAAVVDGGRRQGLPWKLRVPGNGNRPPRETPVAQWAGQLLRHWLDARVALGIVSPWLFPGTRRGGPWGKVTQYDAVKSVLESAGIQPADGGSFRLRHTFALRQLRRGKSLVELAAWMGIVDPAELERYRRVLVAPVDVV